MQERPTAIVRQDGQVIADGQPTGLYAAGWRQVWRIGINGDAHRFWEPTMPRLDDTVLDCAIFLYASEEDANQGRAFGGSGFLVGVPYEDENGRHIYAVTVRHIIEAGYSVIRLNTKEGAIKTIAPEPEAWVYHPKGDDLAVALIHLAADKYKFRYLTKAYFIDQTRMTRSRVGAGDEIFMVGRFVGRDERQRNAPIARFGHMATAQAELINQGIERDEFMQESFLVETHSISGLSGSPVFVWIPLDRIHPSRDQTRQAEMRRSVRGFQPREFFLGINWGHLDEKLKDDRVFPGIAGVIPAWKLSELLNDARVKEMRREEERTAPKAPSGKLDMRKPSQTTRAGEEIPIPRKADFVRDLDKATRRKKPS